MLYLYCCPQLDSRLVQMPSMLNPRNIRLSEWGPGICVFFFFCLFLFYAPSDSHMKLNLETTRIYSDHKGVKICNTFGIVLAHSRDAVLLTAIFNVVVINISIVKHIFVPHLLTFLKVSLTKAELNKNFSATCILMRPRFYLFICSLDLKT